MNNTTSRFIVAMVVSTYVSLAALGCGGGPQRQYSQGVPVAPRPPVFVPSQDAPHTFEPDRPQTLPQPGPRPTRILPETPESRKEPGLWATEPPRAAKLPESPAKWPDPPHILGWPLPHPTHTGTPDDRYYARKCAYYMSLQAEGLPLASPDSLTLDVAKCFAAKLYRACMGIEADEAKRRQPEPYFDTHITNTRKTAEKFEGEACNGVDWNPDIDALFNGAVLKHKRTNREAK